MRRGPPVGAQLLALYDELGRYAPSPVVALNRDVALSYAVGPAEALAEVEGFAHDPRLARTHHLPVVRADLLRRLGRRAEAAAAYRAALEQTKTEPECSFVRRRLAELAETP